MVPHRFRILALILFAFAEIAIAVLAAKDIISADTALAIGGTLAGLATTLGLADVSAVERRRRDPSVAALSDDVRREDDVQLARAIDDARGRAPTDTLLAIGLAIVVGASALTSGCGAGAIGMHARAALVTTSVVQVSGEALDVARDASLDRVQAEHATAPAEVHDAAVRAEAARWRPVGAALDAVRSALLTWIQAVDLARIAGEEDVSLGALVPIAVRVLDLYGRVAALARELGADVPALPGWLTGLLGVALPVRAGGAS